MGVSAKARAYNHAPTAHQCNFLHRIDPTPQKNDFDSQKNPTKQNRSWKRKDRLSRWKNDEFFSLFWKIFLFWIKLFEFFFNQGAARVTTFGSLAQFWRPEGAPALVALLLLERRHCRGLGGQHCHRLAFKSLVCPTLLKCFSAKLTKRRVRHKKFYKFRYLNAEKAETFRALQFTRDYSAWFS